MKPLVALSLIAVLLYTPGCSDSSSPEEEAYLHIGAGNTPVWKPDDSAITARGLPQSGAGINEATLVFFAPTGNRIIDQLELGGPGELISWHAWSHNAADPSLIYTTVTLNPTTYHLWRLDDIEGTPVKLLDSPVSISSPSWSSDNSLIVFFQAGMSSEVYTLDSEGGEPAPLSNNLGWGETAQLSYVRCASDGPYLVYASKYPTEPQNIFRIDLAGGEPTKLTELTESVFRINCIEVSPDGGTLAYIMRYPQSQYQFVYLQNMSGGEPVRVIETAFDTFAPAIRQSVYLSWSPDGTKIVVGTSFFTGSSYDYDIYVVPLDEYLN
jgi:Tol biopolymer transport system component